MHVSLRVKYLEISALVELSAGLKLEDWKKINKYQSEMKYMMKAESSSV